VDGTRTIAELPKWLVRACLSGAAESDDEVGDSPYAPPRATTGRMKARLNPAQLGLLIDRYVSGKTVYELAADFGINRQTVSVILKREGVPMRMQGIKDAQHDEIARLRSQGWSFARLGERFNVSGSTIRNYLLRVTPDLGAEPCSDDRNLISDATHCRGWLLASDADLGNS